METEARILEAAGQVLADHGYLGCSTSRIADAAGISKGSIYQYFADKDEVLTALAAKLADEITQAIGKAIDGGLGDDWQSLAAAVLSASFHALERRGEMLRPLFVEAPHIKLAVMITDVVTRAEDVGRTYIALNPGEFRRDLDVDAVMYVLVTMLESVLTDYVSAATTIPRERLTDTLMAVLARTLTNDPAENAPAEPAPSSRLA